MQCKQCSINAGRVAGRRVTKQVQK